MKRFIVNFIFVFAFAFVLNAQEVFINEINYLNEERPFVEVVAPSTIDIDGYTLHYYNAAGEVYHTQPVEVGSSDNDPNIGNSPSDECISRFVIIDVVIMLTDDKSGVAMTDPHNSLVQYVTYGGTNVAQGGPAKNVVSDNIGKQATDDASLQLTGEGNSYDDFIWDAPGSSTAGVANEDQDVSCEEGSIAGKANLPVEWISFTAEAESKGIALEWRTATEEDNSRFVLEHSRNGYEFNEIVSIAAKGTLEAGAQYSYFDNKPVTGDNYYRIAQIDGSGEKNYFRLLNVRFAASGNTYEVFPNPASDEFTIELPTPQEDVQVDIFSAAGQLVKTIHIEQADIFIPINIHDLSKGYYQIVVHSRTDVVNLPLVVK